jgi:signal transduction histidine kinase
VRRLVGGGDVRPLPASVELAAFRIVQEAITNVVRHSGARHADVRLDYGADVLRVQVADDGTGGTRIGSLVEGSGIRGMRERAAALGGTLTADASGSGECSCVPRCRWAVTGDPGGSGRRPGLGAGRAAGAAGRRG